MAKIGTIELREKPLLLAPMEDVTDPTFRYMCKRFGADVMYSEFVAADAIVREAQKSLRKLDMYDYERPLAIQIFGREPEPMAQAARIVAERRPDFIDLNFGCPVKKVATKGAGAGLLRTPELMVEIVRQVARAVDLPVTVKTRLGWDEQSVIIDTLAEQLQDAGAAALTIHGRTRSQFYRGQADWQPIARVKANPRMRIPIFGNGDIRTPQEAARAFADHGVDGVMVGRGAIGRPWVFEQMRRYIDTGQLPPPPTVGQRVAYAREHLAKSLELKPMPRAVWEMRQHLSNYFKGLPNFKETRLRLLTADDPAKVDQMLAQIEHTWDADTPLDTDALVDSNCGKLERL